MHGDREVSTRNLARQIGARGVEPCAPEVAERHTGYLVGGTSPFGTRKKLPVYVERTILDLPRVWVNGGRRGHLVSLAPADLMRVLEAKLVDAAAAG
jgi:Cys-tRNA(Pro) deacylase